MRQLKGTQDTLGRRARDNKTVTFSCPANDAISRPTGRARAPAGTLPAFLHAGFKAAAPADVRALMGRMEADGITIAERDDEAAYAAFKCLDPDGHRIEVYWELPLSR